MTSPIPFAKIARLPLPGDNVAIATIRLEAGTRVEHNGDVFVIDHTVMEGHRFALATIDVDEPLLSWQLPFGYATTKIAPGSYVINPSTLAALSGRQLDFDLPAAPNFIDRIEPYQLDEATFQPAEALPPHLADRTFLGYRRPGARGVGTRNYVVLLGTTSRVGPFVKRLEARLQPLVAALPNVDGVVAIAHTEGGEDDINNLHLVLPTLAGFMVNPNVGAVLAVDDGVGPVNNGVLSDFLTTQGYTLDDLPHQFLTIETSFSDALDRAQAIVQEWLPAVNQTQRTPESISNLKIALQCGGSDAFSGVSGNPLVGWVAREVIRYGGSANLAETDELIGAESYLLQKVRDLPTAQKFLATIERFKEWASWHGTSAEGNPSGGNKYRGLYNIVLKSIGAAMKRDPDVRLDYVIDYSEPMTEPGYYFMDSPGNDLESIAGQVASGCNLIFFVTGNGSITNFPFVPTIKVVTTSERYRLLENDMDVNAGAYLGGTPMDELGAAMLDLTVDVASGELSVGERAGHSQVQLWRNWRQGPDAAIDHLVQMETASGRPLPVSLSEPVDAGIAALRYPAFSVRGEMVGLPVGLVLPTSLCAAQVAQLAVRRLNQTDIAAQMGLSRFVALVHTEGCGSSPEAKEMTSHSLLGYLRHPLVASALLMEHGCEITHNDHMRLELAAIGLDPAQFGWASIQADGGIQHVLANVEDWFRGQAALTTALPTGEARLVDRRFGLFSDGPISERAAAMLAHLTAQIVAAGGTVVVPESAGLLTQPVFVDTLLGDNPIVASLAYGQRVETSGFHIMATPTSHWVETLVGLGATGVEMVTAHVGLHPLEGHPLLPVLQVTESEAVAERYGDDIDLVLNGDAMADSRAVASVMRDILCGERMPAVERNGNVDFQLTRGLLGISM